MGSASTASLSSIKSTVSEHFTYLPLDAQNRMLRLGFGKYGTYPVINVEMWERGYCGDPDSVEGAFQLDELILLNKDEEFEAKLMAQYESQSQKEARQKEEERQRQIKALEQQLATLKG